MDRLNVLSGHICRATPSGVRSVRPDATSGGSAGRALTNWAGNITFNATEELCPATVAEVIEIVKRCCKLRVLGSKHSFNRLADTHSTVISLQKMSRVLNIDRENRRVTVEGGITYGQLCPVLEENGMAVHNLASLPHISIAGAVATGTHGSGRGNGNLATAVRGLEFVSGSGELVQLDDRTPEDLAGAVASVGALGVITALTLEVQSRYDVSQVLYGPMPLDTFAANADAVMGSEYSVSGFTTWGSGSVEIWRKRRHSGSDKTDEAWPDTFFGAPRIMSKRHPVPSNDPVNCTEQEAQKGPWFDRLPHFKFEFTPSAGEEIQSEYFVPWECREQAIKAVSAIGSQIEPVLMVSELRSIAADELWLSPHFRRPSLAFHFTWERDWPRVKQALSLVEDALRPFEPRPHLGKTFTMSPEHLQEALQYGLPRFRSLVQKYDPNGKFRNAFIEKYVLSPAANATDARRSEWLNGAEIDTVQANGN